MTRKRVLNLVLIFVLILIAAFFIVDPFEQSDLEAWKNEVSEEDYLQAIALLEANMEAQRFTYFDFYEDIELDYTLQPSAVANFPLTTDDGEGGLAGLFDPGEVVTFDVVVDEGGYYTFTGEYRITGDTLNNVTISIKINEEETFNTETGLTDILNNGYQYDDMKTIDLPLRWKDKTKEFQTDTYGDESLPTQVKITEWTEMNLYNNTYTSSMPLVFELQAGSNEIQIQNVSNGELQIRNFHAKAPEQLPTYSEYIANLEATYGSDLEADPFNDFINAISYTEKNSSYARMLSLGNPSVTPYDNEFKKLNVIDGSAWDTAGQEVTYEVTIEEAGLYDLTLHYANYKTDYQTFRSIRIDGEIPFEEFASYGFDYTPSRWANKTLEDKDGNPYKVYLDAGTHTISFRAEKSDVSEYLRNLQFMIDHINEFALEIIEITGKDIDRNRTWRLTNYIPYTEDYLLAYQDIIKYTVVQLSEYSDKDDLSSVLSYLKKAVFEFDKMLEEPDELPLYLANLYSGSGSVTLQLGNTIDLLNDQQLYLNGFYVSNDGNYNRPNANFFKRTGNSLTSFVNSFTSDKYNIENSDEVIDVWVNRPLTYVDIMQKMVDVWSEDSGIDVKISVMPDPNKLILANAAGNTPDVALGLMSYMPFDLAIRGALYDLSTFDDFWLNANLYAPGSMVPYILEDGVYAIPETLDFHALVYRKDVFRTLDIPVPDTWDDVIGILPILQRYDMNFYYPTSGGTALKWFYQTTPLIYQNGGALYDQETGIETTIDSPEAVKGLQLLGDLYTTYSLPEQVQVFYNSFRYNELPVGIIDFMTYLQLKNAAPELTGQWEIAPYPGTYNEETDSVDRWYVGNGTGGVMFKNTDDAQESWEFMKWWTSTETQSTFAYTLQSTYGPEFLWLSGNVEAIANSPIDNADKAIIIEQVRWLRDVPRTPGQYMLERGLSNIWNTVTFDGTPVRVAIDREVILINREIKRKMVEFGYGEYIDGEYVSIKPYTIHDVDWIQEQMDNAKDGE